MGKQKKGKTVIFDQLNDLPDMVAQWFTTLFDVFHLKEMLQDHGFSYNTQSVLKYFTLIMFQMYVFDNNTSKIDALAKHTIAETYCGKRILARP